MATTTALTSSTATTTIIAIASMIYRIVKFLKKSIILIYFDCNLYKVYYNQNSWDRNDNYNGSNSFV